MAVKKTASKKKSSNKKSSPWMPTVRNSRIWLFVLLFGVVGFAALTYSNAKPKLPTYSDDIVAGYINLTPTIISNDGNGNVAYEAYPSSIYLQADGTLVCDGGVASGTTVKTGALNRGQVEKIQRDLLDTDVTSLDNEIAPADTQAVVQYEGILVSQGEEAKGTAVYAGAQKPDKFVKAQERLQSLCDKATVTQERGAVRTPREPKLKNDKKNVLTSFLEEVTPKASACCAAGTRDTNFEVAHWNSINDWRAQNGRARLPGNLCIADRASIWSGQMAKAGYISHSPNIGKDASACYPNWTLAGENVGKGYDNSGLMAKFKSSPTHNNNMLDTRWRVGGVGAVRINQNGYNTIYVTQRYVRY